MNIEALLEDLEAQGYFASSKVGAAEQTENICKMVLVVRDHSADCYLSLPLLGRNFIAGFNNKSAKSVWLLIQDYQHLELQESGTKLQQTDLSLKKVIKTHLVGAVVRVGIANSSHGYRGYIVGVRGTVCEFVNLEARRLHLPLAKISYLAVEKLSIESKV